MWTQRASLRSQGSRIFDILNPKPNESLWTCKSGSMFRNSGFRASPSTESLKTSTWAQKTTSSSPLEWNLCAQSSQKLGMHPHNRLQ